MIELTTKLISTMTKLSCNIIYNEIFKRNLGSTTTTISSTDTTTNNPEKVVNKINIDNTRTADVTHSADKPKIIDSDALLKENEEILERIRLRNNEPFVILQETKSMEVQKPNFLENPVKNYEEEIPGKSYHEEVSSLKLPRVETSVNTNIEKSDSKSTEIENLLIGVEASCNLSGEKVSSVATKLGVVLEECEAATKRQTIIHNNIKQLVTEFWGTRGIRSLALGIGVGFTVYYIWKYKQIPLGGFLKGLFSSSSGSAKEAAAEISSNIVGPTNNITITFPPTETLNAAKNTAVDSSLSNAISTIIDQLGVGGIFTISAVIFLLKKFK